VKKREKESEKEKKRALKPILVSLFPAPQLLRVGWQKCNNTSSLQQAPSNNTNTTSSKKKFNNSTQKEIYCFQH
jgi:hypothetical protein